VQAGLRRRLSASEANRIEPMNLENAVSREAAKTTKENQ
jgi:hypothetical protein